MSYQTFRSNDVRNEMRRTQKEQRRAAKLSSALSNAVVIVTGASSGIGAATAREFARNGAQVILAARRVEELAAQAQTITSEGLNALAIPTDITDAAQVTQLVKLTIEKFGRVDVLVNNAGIGRLRPFYKEPVEYINQVIDVNLRGAMLMTHAVLPGMFERRSGAIISIASVAGHVALNPLYSSTKFGLRGFSLSLRRDLLRRGISVSLVSPGFIDTNMNKRSRLPMPGPELVARTIVNLVVKPRREVIVPGYYGPLVAIANTFPWLVDLVMSRRK
jgi:NAD(P)-dependent dehydrogenase (short-subunit alcohol dehydrogenase family)